ncbi:MAG: hypothetical protein PVI40_04130 [Chlamydiota bacterium]|jgi:hypothetical protein
MASATRNTVGQFTTNATPLENREGFIVSVTGQSGTYTLKAANESEFPALFDRIFAHIADKALEAQKFELADNAAHEITVQSQRDPKIQKIEAVLLKNKSEMEEAIEALKADFLNKIEGSTINTTSLALEKGLLITVTVQGKSYEQVTRVAKDIPWALDAILADIVKDAADNQNFELAFQAAHQIEKDDWKKEGSFSKIIYSLADLKSTLKYESRCDQIPFENKRNRMRENMIKELLNDGLIGQALQQAEKISNQYFKNSSFCDIALAALKQDVKEGIDLNLAIQNALNIAGNITEISSREHTVHRIIQVLVEKGEIDEARNLAHSILTPSRKDFNLCYIAEELLKKDDIEKALEVINTDLLNSEVTYLRGDFFEYLEEQLKKTNDLQVIYNLSEKVMNQVLKRAAYDLIFITHLESGNVDEALQIASRPLKPKPSGKVYNCLYKYLNENLQTHEGLNNLLKIAKGLANAHKTLHEFFIDKLTNHLVLGKAIDLAKKIACTPLSTSLVNEQICYRLIEKGHIEEALKLAKDLPVFKDGNRIKNDSLSAVANAYAKNKEPRTALEVLNMGVGYQKSVNLSLMLARNIDKIEKEVFEDFINIATEECQRSEGILKAEALKFLVIALTEGCIQFKSLEYLNQAIRLASDSPEEGQAFENLNLALIGSIMVNKDHLDGAKGMLAIMGEGHYKEELSQKIAFKMIDIGLLGDAKQIHAMMAEGNSKKELLERIVSMEASSEK